MSTKKIYIILCVLALCLLFLWFYSARKREAFLALQTSQVTSIHFACEDEANKDRGSTHLQKQADKWLLNGEQEVDPVSIRSFMDILGSVMIANICPSDQNPFIGQEASRVRLRVYKKIAFFSLKMLDVDVLQQEGKMYWRKKGNQEVFEVEAPAFDLAKSPYFSCMPDVWGGRDLVNLYSHQIETVKVIVLEDTAQSFVLTQEKTGNLQLFPSYGKPVDSLKMKDFLNSFVSVYYNKKKIKEKIAQEMGVALEYICIKPFKGDSICFYTFQKQNFVDGKPQADIFNLWVVRCSPIDTLEVSYFVLDRIRKKRAEFDK